MGMAEEQGFDSYQPDAGREEVSTVFVGGLPPDATPRELDNLCRFLPGFTNAKVDARKGKTLFARFDTQSSALSAITALNGQVFDRTNPGEPMRAVLAKSNMKSDRPPSWGSPYGGPSAAQPPPAVYPPVGSAPGNYNAAVSHSPGGFGGLSTPPLYAGPAGKRPRALEHPSEVDTVASVGAAEKGFDEAALHGFFLSLPGFITFKANPRMGGGFAKFDSAAYAVQAISAAHQQGIPAEIAKSSMNNGGFREHPPVGLSSQGGLAGEVYSMPSPGHGHGTKRPRMADNPYQVDTVASVGAAEQGIDEATLHSFFMSLPGFLAFKGNPRMGGGFAKFESASLASQAVASAQQQGIPADIAKSNMTAVGSFSGTPGLTPAPAQSAAASYSPAVDTVAAVGAAERGFDELALQAFFMEQPGFLTFKANPRMGGGFAKFESPGLAAQCVAKAQENAIPLEIAKTSMSSVN